MLITKTFYKLFEHIDLERLKSSFSNMTLNESDTSKGW